MSARMIENIIEKLMKEHAAEEQRVQGCAAKEKPGLFDKFRDAAGDMADMAVSMKRAIDTPAEVMEGVRLISHGMAIIEDVTVDAIHATIERFDTPEERGAMLDTATDVALHVSNPINLAKAAVSGAKNTVDGAKHGWEMVNEALADMDISNCAEVRASIAERLESMDPAIIGAAHDFINEQTNQPKGPNTLMDFGAVQPLSTVAPPTDATPIAPTGQGM